jgi:hypothetical protein
MRLWVEAGLGCFRFAELFVASPAAGVVGEADAAIGSPRIFAVGGLSEGGEFLPQDVAAITATKGQNFRSTLNIWSIRLHHNHTYSAPP